MTKHPASYASVLAEANEYDPEDAEDDATVQPTGLFSFPGAQHFDEIMHEKMRPKKLAKFKATRNMESDY